MSSPSPTSFRMVLSPYARDRFNYERGATKTLVSFLPYTEHNPEEVIVGLEVSHLDYDNYIELIIGAGQAVINNTMISIDEPISLDIEKPFGGDGVLKVFFTSNKFEDLMGQVTLNVMTEQEYEDFSYKNRLLATLTFEDYQCSIEQEDFCRISIIDVDLAMNLGKSFRLNNVYLPRSELQAERTENAGQFRFNGFYFDLPPDYQFKTTSDADVYLVTEDRKIVMDGKLFEYGFIDEDQTYALSYFELSTQQLKNMIAQKIHNIYLGVDGELWQVCYRLVYSEPDVELADSLKIAQIRNDQIQLIKNIATLAEVLDDKVVPVSKLNGYILLAWVDGLATSLFSNQFENYKPKEDLLPLMKDKTAVFITTELEAVHVKLSENPDDFITIDNDEMENTIDKNLIYFPSVNLRLKVDYEKLDCTYEELFQKFVFMNFEANDVTKFELSTNPFHAVTPFVTVFDDNGLMRSSISIEKLQSFVDMGTEAYKVGANHLRFDT
jgi:hypothetical protein